MSRPPRRSAIAELILPADPERALSLAYAPAGARPALSLLWRIDEQLGAIVARTENPAVGQMRLTWWHDAFVTLATTVPADPLLVELKQSGLDALQLAPLIDGWEVLLDPLPLEPEELVRFGEARGATLFRIAAHMLESRGEGVEQAGSMWALVDLAFRVSDRETARRALAVVRTTDQRLPRTLAVLASLARRDLLAGLDRPRRQGSPARILRAMIAGAIGR